MFDVSFQKGEPIPNQGRLIYLLNQLCVDLADDVADLRLRWGYEIKLDTVILTAWRDGVIAVTFETRYITNDFQFFKDMRPMGWSQLKNLLVSALNPTKVPVGI